MKYLSRLNLPAALSPVMMMDRPQPTHMKTSTILEMMMTARLSFFMVMISFKNGLDQLMEPSYHEN